MNAKTPTQRMKDMRDRIKQNGGKTLSISVSSELLGKMAAIIGADGSELKSHSAVVRAGIEAKYHDYLNPNLITEQSAEIIKDLKADMRKSAGEIIELALANLAISLDTDNDEDEDDDEYDGRYF